MNDQLDGQSQITFDDGTFYIGEMHQNKFHGKGKFVFPNGRVWEGTWHNNYLHGPAWKYNKVEIKDGVYRPGELDQDSVGIYEKGVKIG